MTEVTCKYLRRHISHVFYRCLTPPIDSDAVGVKGKRTSSPISDAEQIILVLDRDRRELPQFIRYIYIHDHPKTIPEIS